MAKKLLCELGVGVHEQSTAKAQLCPESLHSNWVTSHKFVNQSATSHAWFENIYYIVRQSRISCHLGGNCIEQWKSKFCLGSPPTAIR